MTNQTTWCNKNKYSSKDKKDLFWPRQDSIEEFAATIDELLYI